MNSASKPGCLLSCKNADFDNGKVGIQFQVAPDDFVHLMVRGTAEVLNDQPTKDRVWDVLDYDLAQFWPDGPASTASNK